MPAIQRIRNHGAWLIGVIGLALFAFIAEEFFRSMETTSNHSKQQVGEVYGETLSIQDFQEMVNEATEVYKMRTGQNLSDAMQDQVRDQVWNEFVIYQLVKHETDALGLYVTDAEVQNALVEGTAQSLQNLSMFANQQGRFDYTALQTFIKQYNEMKGKAQGEQLEQIETIYNLWKYSEKQLRKELLMNKYQGLFSMTMLANPVCAKAGFEDRNTTNTTVVAALPFAAIKDKVEVTDDELKDAYNTYKENFRLDAELRDIKYIDVAVTASKADKEALDAEMNGIYEKLAAGTDPAVVVGSSNSLVRFADMPVSANAFPYDIRQVLDSMSVGQTKQPYRNMSDNTMNVVKLMAKTATADSILYRAIFVQGKDEADVQQRHDSIMTALRAGAAMKAIAKKYGQNADSAWVTSAQLEQGMSQPENVKFAKALYDGNGYTSLELNGNKLILDIMQKKGSSAKYVAAVVKCNINFSKDTYNQAKNKLNLFLAANKDLAAVEKAAAKAGYQVVETPNFSSASHNIGANGRMPGVAGSKDALRWAFDDAKVGEISKIYDCGEANDHILVVGLSAIHEKGYMPWDAPDVKNFLTSVVTAQKKGEIAAKKLAGVKTIEAAQGKGAVVDTLKNSNFFLTPFISATQAPEAKVAAAIYAAKVNETTAPVIGTAGAYVLKVVAREKGKTAFNAETEKNMLARQYMQMSQAVFGDLVKKAKIVDNRYKF